MKKTTNNVYIFTPAELMVLAAGKGINGMFGLGDSFAGIDEAEVCKAMNHLYQLGIIQNSDNDAFVLNNDIQEIMTTISQSHEMMLVRDFTKKALLKVIYIGQRPAVTEQLSMRKETIRLYSFPKEELTDFLQDDVLGKSRSYRVVLDEMNVLAAILKNKEILQQKEIDKLGNALVLFEMVSKVSRRVNRRIVLMQGSESQKIYDYKNGKELKEISGEHDILHNIINMIQEV